MLCHLRRSHLLLAVSLAGGVSLGLLLLSTSAGAQTGAGGSGGNGSGGDVGGAGGTGSATGVGGTGGNGPGTSGGGGGGAGTNGGNGGSGFGGAGAAGGVGPGASGADSSGHGGGGGGAHGAVVTVTTTNAAAIVGGNGGSAAALGFNTGGGSGGGAGGYGVVVNGAGLTYTNSGTITGGKGGAGDNSAFAGNVSGSGGSGGHGVFLTGNSTLINSGTITGGNGGAAGDIAVGATAGTPGAGGVGVIGSGITVINTGIISGGFGNNGVGNQADALTFTGGTNVYQGTGGTLNGNVTVNTGATLNVIGTLNNSGFVTVNGGIAAGPVGGIGTATIPNAILVLNSGSSYIAQVNPSGASSRLVVNNNVFFNGSNTLVVNGPTGFYGGKTYNVLSFLGGFGGGASFTGITDNIPGTTATFSLITDPNNNALLDVIVQVFGGQAQAAFTGQTFNQSSAANGLNGLVANGAVAGSLLNTFNGLNAAQLNFTLDQMSGEVYASALSAGIENQALWLRTVAQHVRLANQCLCPETGANGEFGCNGDGVWRSWATPFGQAGTNQGDGNAHAFAYPSVGLAAGSDRRVGDDSLIGFATGYSNWGNTTNFLNSSAFSNSFNLASYGRTQIGQAWVLGIASYEYDGYNSRRPMDLLGSVANADFTGNQLGAYVESGYAITLGGAQVQPLAALQYISAWRGSVNESGAGALDLNVESARADSFRSQLGGRFLYPITTDSGRCILPEAGAYWIHEYAQNSRGDVSQFAGGGPQFLASGGNLGRDFGLFTAGLSTQAGPSIRLGINYQSYVTPSAVAHGGMGQIQFTW